MLMLKQNKQLKDLFKPYRKAQLSLCLLLSLQIILTAYIPFQIKELINLITINEALNLIIKTGLIIVVLTIIGVLIGMLQNYYWHRTRLSSVNYLRLKMFESALQKNKVFFDKHTTGEILAKIMDDVVIVAQNLVIGLPMLFANVLTLVVVVFVLFKLSFRLAIICIIILPIYYGVFHFLNKRIRHTSKMERERFSKVMEDAQEKLLGITTIKLFRKHNYILNKFKTTLDGHFKFVSKNALFNSLGTGLNSLIMSLLPIIILIYGGYLIKNSLITLGSLIAFYTYLSNIYEPISNLSNFNMGLQTALGMKDRILDFLNSDLEQDFGTVEISKFEYLEFKNVSFSYDSDKYILDNISFRINRGDKVAFIGNSGGGKSTILSLIARIYRPNSGEIIINGYNLEDINQHSLYSIIALLDQNPFVFNGSMEENISLGNTIDSAILNEVIAASRTSDLVTDNKSLKEYNITEFGSNLSGGQKQRLCLCRILAKHSQIIILDEATSALDIELENQIVDNLNSFFDKNDKTLITVSHRPSILKICNKVIQIENGTLKENPPAAS
jgi:ABC-type multidrug transport system fused ATPase/permease subunit